jgi:hypothetical protein
MVRVMARASWSVPSWHAEREGLDMDPNVALARIRYLATKVLRNGSGWNEAELAMTVQDLDDWIKKGGLLPSDWTRKS